MHFMAVPKIDLSRQLFISGQNKSCVFEEAMSKDAAY